MKIDTIKASNLKGRTFTRKLGAFTAVLGNNQQGKSAIIDALTVAALGYHPALGKTPSATMQLATGTTMEAIIGLSNGKSGGYKFTRTDTGGRKTHTGDEIQIDPALLNSALFLQASVNARASMIRERFPAAGDPREKIMEAVRAVPNLPTLPKLDADDLAEWIDKLDAAIKAAGKEASEQVKQMTQTIQGLAAMQLNDEDAVATAEAIKQIEADLKDAERKVTETSVAINNHKKDLDEGREKLTRWSEAEPAAPADFAGISTDAAHEAEIFKKIEAAKAELQTLRAKMELYSKQDASRKTWRLKLATAKEALAAYDPIPAKPSLSLREINAEIDNQRINQHRAQSELERLRADYQKAITRGNKATHEIERITELKQKTTCETCGASREHWSEEMKNWAEELLKKAEDEDIAAGKEITEIGSKLEATREILDIATTKRKQADEELAAAEAFEGYTKALADKETADAMLRDLGESVDNMELAESINDQQDTIANLEEGLEGIREWIDFQNATSLVAAADANIARERAEMDRQAVEVDTLNSKLAQWREKDAKRIAAEAEQARIDTAKETIAKRTLEVEAAKAAATILKDTARAAAEQALGPVLTLGRYFSEGLLPTEITARGLDIGRWDGPTWVSLNVFSGSEQAVTVAAIQAALASASESKIFILDEMARLDEAHERILMERIRAALQDNMIDQAIVITSRGIPENLLDDVTVLAV